MATVNFYLDTRRAKKDGTYPLKLLVRHNGSFLVSTDFNATKETWKENNFTREAPNHKAKNIAVRNLINKVETCLLTLEQTGKLKQINDKKLKLIIESEIRNESAAEHDFLYYLDEFVAGKTNAGTKTVYSTTRNKLAEYDLHCTFDTMTREWLVKFEQWMIAQGMKVNAYAIHLRNIRAVFNYAIDEEYTTLYPFRKFKIKKEETRKRCLTAQQLIQLRDYPCEEYQTKYRDMFMLMFYLIGINAVDLFLAKDSNVVNGRLEYKRAKTGKQYSILIQPEAQDIINKYKGREYLVNVMDEYGNYKDFLHRMGNALKEIGEMKRAGRGGKKIRTPLFPEISSYWSRHTWATLAAELDIPKETISEALGHEYGCTTTSIYINFNQKKVDQANRTILDYIQSPQPQHMP